MPGIKYFSLNGETILGQPIELVAEPYPMQRRIPLASKCPELISEWYWEKNCGYGPDDFSFGSQVNVWWRCPVASDHIWRQQINVRAKGHGCPACDSKKVSVTNSLEQQHALAKEWHPEFNDKKPSEVTARCDYLAYWQCQKNIQHVYQASINDRTRTDGRGSGCPLCRKESTGLGQFPEVLKYFDRKRNKGIDPLSLPVAKKIWWTCSVANDHVWSAALWTHSNEKTLTCPYCAGRKASSTNNLTLSPLLNAEYDRAKNKLPVNKVTLISKKQVGWICSICKHKWETSPNLRYKKEYGCPECAHNALT